VRWEKMSKSGNWKGSLRTWRNSPKCQTSKSRRWLKKAQNKSTSSNVKICNCPKSYQAPWRNFNNFV
jgi:hypothetical protein